MAPKTTFKQMFWLPKVFLCVFGSQGGHFGKCLFPERALKLMFWLKGETLVKVWLQRRATTKCLTPEAAFDLAPKRELYHVSSKNPSVHTTVYPSHWSCLSSCGSLLKNYHHFKADSFFYLRLFFTPLLLVLPEITYPTLSFSLFRIRKAPSSFPGAIRWLCASNLFMVPKNHLDGGREDINESQFEEVVAWFHYNNRVTVLMNPLFKTVSNPGISP